MKICFYIPGSVIHGTWSPERGESRWAQNLAMAYAHANHEVILISDNIPQWGNCPPIPGIELVRASWPLIHRGSFLTDGSLDLFIDSSWWHGKPLNDKVQAKAYWHTHYGFEQHLKDPNWIKENHYIIFPYQQSSFKFLNENNPFIDRTFNVPIPLFQDKPLSSNFCQKGLVWSGKDCFLDRFQGQEKVLINSSLMIDALTFISVKYPDIPIHFLMSQQLENNYREANQSLKEYDVENRLNKIKGARFYKILNYNQVLKIITNSQVVTPPHWCGSHLEAVANGTVPLIRSGFIFDEAAQDLDMLLPTYSDNFNEIVNNIEKLMFNKELYNKCLVKYQEQIMHHSEINAIKFLNYFKTEFLS